jgi:hypothetical protein
MPYRILCNGTEQKNPEARSGLGLVPSRFIPLHKIRYGIQAGPRKGRPYYTTFMARVRFIILQSAWCGEHDDRKGHHYYTAAYQAHSSVYSSDDPCGHHGAGAVIMPGAKI